MSEIKESKIKVVHNISEPFGQYQTLYHHLELENGDKIDIGKKTVQKEGWRVTYQLTGEPGQQEFTKAKSCKPLESPAPNNAPSTKATNAPQQRQQFTQDPNKTRSIEMQVCLIEANNYHAAHGFVTDDPYTQKKEVCDTAEMFYDEMFNPEKK